MSCLPILVHTSKNHLSRVIWVLVTFRGNRYSVENHTDLLKAGRTSTLLVKNRHFKVEHV